MSAVAALRQDGNVSVGIGEATLWGLGEPLVLGGHYKLRVLRGGVEVGGCRLVADMARSYHISCPVPPFYQIIPVHTLSSENFCTESKLQGHFTVVHIEEVKVLNIAQLAPPFKSMNSPLNITDGPLWQLPASWRDIGFRLSHMRHASVIVLGPKNSGKSSLSRYLVGQFPGKVHYLDLDPGQCEYCAPGTLSLLELEGPLLALPWTHSHFDHVLKAHSLGYPSPIETPQAFLAMCRNLFDFWSSLTDKLPLVVNTPGWTKGLGLELNAVLLKMIDASLVVHMGEDDAVNELPCPVEIVQPTESLIKFSGSELRTLQTLSYFHRYDSRHLTLQSPYDLEWGKHIHAVAICNGVALDPSDVIMALEGTIVSIVAIDPKRKQEMDLISGTEVPCLVPYVADNIYTLGSCVGYAVIQKMSPKGVRLLTPFNPMSLGGLSVVLCRGRLAMPLWLLWDQKSLECPWLTQKMSGVGSVYTKFRRNIQRN